MPVILPQHRQARIGASVGIAGYPLHANDAASLLRAADAAMYKVKRTGKNDFQVAEPTPMQRPLELVERPVTEAHT
jgi:diguanylate cyclase (GGDEF)-like protein